jgi:hypothetical protein
MLHRIIAYLIYMTGVVFLYWNYQALKSSLDTFSFFVFLGFFLFGVNRFATFISTKWAVVRK